MKQKLMVLAGAVLLLFALSACDIGDLMRGNLFAKMEKYSISLTDVKEKTGEDLVEDLKVLVQYPGFFDDLKQDKETKDAILGSLEDTFTDPAAEPPQVQEAALIYIEIQFKTTGAEDVAEGVMGLIGSFIPSGDGEGDGEGEETDASGLGESFLALFDGLSGDELTDTLEAMDESSDAFEAYVESLYDPAADSYYFPPGTDVLDITSKALACAMVSLIGVDNMTAILTGEDEIDNHEVKFDGTWVGNLFEALGNYFGS